MIITVLTTSGLMVATAMNADCVYLASDCNLAIVSKAESERDTNPRPNTEKSYLISYVKFISYFLFTCH